MKYLLSGVAALAVLSGCGPSGDKTGDAPLGDVSIRAGDPAEAEAVISAMSLTNSGDGAVAYATKSVDGAKASFSDITIAGDDAGGVKAASLEFDGLDMVDGKASFSKMTLSDISIEDEEMDDTTVSVGTIEVLNPTPELAAWLASSFGDAEPAPFPSAEQVGFDSWSIKDVAVGFDDADAKGTFGISNFEVRDLKDQKAARAVLSGLKFDVLDEDSGIPVKMNLDSLSMSGLDLAFLEAIQENLDDEEAMMEAIMSKVYDQPMDPGYDKISLSNFSVDAAGASFKMPSLDASVERNSDGQPVKYVTKPFSMTLDADPDGGEAGAGLAQALSMVGYESVELKGAGVSTYDPDKDIITFAAKDNYFELVDGAKFSFGGKLAGYAAYSKEAATAFDFEAMAEGEEPDPMALQGALGELELYNFELSIDDDSLVDRIFNAVAAQSGEDPAQMRQQASMMMGMAPMMAQGSGVDMEMVTELATAVSAFITDPGTLTIKLNPESPLSVETLSTMEDPSLLTKKYLGFSATHK
ncbi:hypothetical protein WNY37_01520 [Henriciella sp. AS95]|uniref:hypothetical protein n=1 Tax=Henriciella sp. AS95 TaxID=3135782 RepID=UPI00317401B0